MQKFATELFLPRICFEPLCDNLLDGDSEISRGWGWKASFVLQKGFCLFTKLFPLANLLHAISEVFYIISRKSEIYVIMKLQEPTGLKTKWSNSCQFRWCWNPCQPSHFLLFLLQIKSVLEKVGLGPSSSSPWLQASSPGGCMYSSDKGTAYWRYVSLLVKLFLHLDTYISTWWIS